MGILKDSKFWIGVLVALLLVGFFPQINLVSKLKGGGGGGSA